MRAPIKPATEQDVKDIEFAFGHLRRARELLARADAPRALERVRDALSSTEGALRHVRHRLRRTPTPPPRGGF